MPRPSLPSSLKILKTFDVALTKTTQEELWSHFVDAFSWYRKRAYYLIEKIEALGEDIDADNPFSKCSWRNTSSISSYPSRKYESETPYDVFDDAEAERYNYLFKIRSDLERCGRLLGWADDEDYKKQFAEFTIIADEVCYDLQHKLHCLAITEYDAYVLARHRWNQTHKNEIDDARLAERHKSHKTKKEWIELFQSDPVAARWCNSIPPNDEDTCKYCIANKERREVEERITITRYRQEQKDAEELRKRQQEEEYAILEVERERKEMENTKHTCEMCDYTTSSGSKFDVHLASKEHTARIKSKSLYCKSCDTQSRSQLEYENHCNSIKHKKVVGLIPEPENYHCELCDFTTPSKHLFKQHNEGKKHNQRKMNAIP